MCCTPAQACMRLSSSLPAFLLPLQLQNMLPVRMHRHAQHLLCCCSILITTCKQLRKSTVAQRHTHTTSAHHQPMIPRQGIKASRHAALHHMYRNSKGAAYCPSPSIKHAQQLDSSIITLVKHCSAANAGWVLQQCRPPTTPPVLPPSPIM